MPVEERQLFLMGGSLLNDMQILSKLLAVSISSCPKDAKAIEKQGDSAVAMLLQRILAGRLHEGWKLLSKHAKLIRASYETNFSDTAKLGLNSARSYFGSSKNHLAAVRNKLGFHADADLAEEAYQRLSDNEELGSYLSRTLGNTIHLTPELMHYEAICEITGEPDHVKATNIIWQETKEQVSNFNSVMNGITLVFAQRYLPNSLSELATEYDDLDVSPLSDLNFRFFSDLSEFKKDG